MGVNEQVFAEAFRRTLADCLGDPLFANVRPLIDDAVKQSLLDYAWALVQANQEVNLTAITDPQDVALKHVADSLLALTVGDWPQHGRLCDVGTGGGVPGAILAIVRPDLHVTFVDSVQKKLRIVQRISSQLDLNTESIHGRAEDLGRAPSLREKFHAVTARAVARLPVLLELCLPLTKVNGCFVALKGPDAQDEVEASAHALQQLGGVVESIRDITLPMDVGRRTLIAVRKVSSTPSKYPRSAGVPAKTPL